MTSDHEQGEARTVLTAVNRLLTEASVLLAESRPPTEEEDEAEREIKHAIANAGLILSKELGRQEREGESRSANHIEYAETYIGECIVGECNRVATVRVHEDYVLCALHELFRQIGAEIDEAHGALE